MLESGSELGIHMPMLSLQARVLHAAHTELQILKWIVVLQEDRTLVEEVCREHIAARLWQRVEEGETASCCETMKGCA